MIQTHYQGALGENLFQYCLARKLAEAWGHRLNGRPIWGFPNTAREIAGKSYLSPVVQWSGIDLRSWATGEPIPVDQLECPVHAHLVLDGWFQFFSYLQDRADEIRNEWLLPDTDHARRPSNEVAISLRLGATTRWRQDRLRHANWEAPPAYPTLDEAGLVRLLESLRGARLHVVTDRPRDKLVSFLRRRGAVVHAEGDWENFRLLRSFHRIAVGHTAYDWWAAFLSRAGTVIPIWGGEEPSEQRRRFLEHGPACVEVPGKRYLLDETACSAA